MMTDDKSNLLGIGLLQLMKKLSSEYHKNGQLDKENKRSWRLMMLRLCL